MASVWERRRFWAQHVARFEGCGLTRGQYCERYDLAPATLDYWRRRLRAEPTPTSTFVPVQPRLDAAIDGSVTEVPSLQLCVGDARLLLPARCDVVWLASLLQALR